MHHTRDTDEIGAALVDLLSFFSSPRRDELLLREAGVVIDRALFPLLVRLATGGPLSVAALADQVGRDHTTISRQLSKLQTMDLVSRQAGGGDRRVRTAQLTAAGDEIVQAIGAARQRLLSKTLADWSPADRAQLASLNRRFAAALAAAARERG